MRPSLLELQGFGAFKDLTTVDFRDADFFALVGPTGAGKSTVIDAMCFALYGNVPRYDDQRLVGAALSLGANEARVRFSFEVGGVGYVAARVIRRSGQGKIATKEARLERLDDGVVLAGRETEMRAAVERVLGLSFDDFTRCVVLPQGAFARFLHDKPAERQALLVRLLDLGVYQRVMVRANTRAAAEQRVLDHLAGQLAELPFVEDGDRADLAARRDRLRGVQVELAEAEPVVAGHERAAASHRDEAARDDRLVAALERISPPDWLARHRELRAQADEALALADRALAESIEAVDRAEVLRGDLPELGVLDAALRAHERIAKGRVVVAERADLAVRCAAAATAADDRRRTAEAVLADARTALQRVEIAHRAHVLAVELQPGEPCPVCEQLVERLPLPVAPPGLDAARAAVAAGERAAADAARAVELAGREATAAQAGHDAAAARLAELAMDVAAWPDPAALQHERARVAAVHEAYEALRSEQRRRAADVAAARRVCDESSERVAGVAAAFHRQRDAVVGLDPPAPAPDLAVAWEELAVWARARHAEVTANRDEARRQAELADAAGRQVLAALAVAVARDGVALPSGAPMDAIRRAVGRAEAEADARWAEIERAAVRRLELEGAVVTARDARAVAAELARQLKADRFQRWLVEAAFRELAGAASDTLRRLSGGQFSLDLNDTSEFVVVDHTAADERRPVRTLSGGETFQASLALALALSQHVMDLAGTRGHQALESIFLDEGFGTLDPDSLEIVASTMEALGDDGRVVGLVTHVKELADRVPVRFVVWKDARSAHVERVDG